MTTTASSGSLSPGSENDRTAFGGLSAKLLSPAGQLATKWADDMCPTSRWGRSAKYSVDGDRPCSVMVSRSLVMLAAVWTNNASMSSSCCSVTSLIVIPLTPPCPAGLSLRHLVVLLVAVSMRAVTCPPLRPCEPPQEPHRGHRAPLWSRLDR